ncbi:hypothetical protein K431DRAFT_285237 [Polychaeton citri CBS 116435]|uniref:Tetratricopeptide SHNi-TPR domain-containing protein n=1 Tax=Polychaeton citri CBS 116435 TaxID=1314669 RepID=A0A9P4UQF7_9PEZI|nr:hypothetical protein K431DRAFT_285237 [Polychaeton citri CBS 116435]
MADQTPTLSDSLNGRLEQLQAQATQQYSLKNYSGAAEFYSEAAELQDEINGEMSPANSDLLYQYGRCLYHVAVSNSDVLGGKVAGEEPKRKKRKVQKGESSTGTIPEEGSSADGAGHVVGATQDGKNGTTGDDAPASKDGDEPKVINKPFFQITGDENWTDSESSDAEADDDRDAEEEEDDFAIAYEILDIARVLLSQKLRNAIETADGGKGKGTESSDVRQIKERLADTHDLQAEISLENERFQDAVNDTRDALALKLELYPQDSSLIAEAHFKLSLALEFASVTTTVAAEGANDSNAKPQQQFDSALREGAAEEMEKAIASCRLRISREEKFLSSLPQGSADAEAKRKSIADVKDMLQDLNNRLVDLKNPAVSLSAGHLGALTDNPGAIDDSFLKGIMGAMLGQPKSEQQKRLQEATAGANDLSGLIKRKKGKADQESADRASSAVAGGKGKRKLEDTAPGEEHDDKKARLVDDAR